LLTLSFQTVSQLGATSSSALKEVEGLTTKIQVCLATHVLRSYFWLTPKIQSTLKSAGVGQKTLSAADQKALVAKVQPLVKQLESKLSATTQSIKSIKASSKAKRGTDPTEQAVAKTVAAVSFCNAATDEQLPDHRHYS
jgi:hypothetical protein